MLGLGGTELYNSVSSLIIQNTWNPHKKKKEKKKLFGKFFECCFYHSKLKKLKKLSLSDENRNNLFEFPELQTWISMALWDPCAETCRVRPTTFDITVGFNFSFSHFIASHFRVSEILISFIFLISSHFLSEVLGQPSVGAMIRCKKLKKQRVWEQCWARRSFKTVYIKKPLVLWVITCKSFLLLSYLFSSRSLFIFKN